MILLVWIACGLIALWWAYPNTNAASVVLALALGPILLLVMIVVWTRNRMRG